MPHLHFYFFPRPCLSFESLVSLPQLPMDSTFAYTILSKELEILVHENMRSAK